MNEPERAKEETPFDRFQRITQKIVSVPKEEIDRREKKWKAKRKGKPQELG